MNHALIFPTLVNMAPAALAHLAQADPVLAALLSTAPPLELRRRLQAARDDHFGALLACLVGQRQAERDTIAQLAQFERRFGTPFPQASQLLSVPAEWLAQTLLSHRKAEYLRGIAQAIVDGALQLDDLASQTDAVVSARLLALKGVGPWSVEQMLFWHLERPDVLVTGDPAVRRALCAAYGLSAFPDADALQELSAPWQPYRSYVARLLLQSRFGPGESEAWPRNGRPLHSTEKVITHARTPHATAANF
jgi:DNA-3-methyladenine glycosylase II